MLEIVRLFMLQSLYTARLVTCPTNAREFWFRLYHDAQHTDRWLQPSRLHQIHIATAEYLFPGIGTQTFSLEDFSEEYGGVSYDEVRVLAASIQLLKPHTLFEFGTFNGASTLQFACNVADDGAVHTIDLPADSPLRTTSDDVDIVPEKIGHRYHGRAASKRIHQIFGNTMEYDFANFYEKCDWIFIDAAHSYEFVMNDTKNALRMLRRGGVIFWHDVRRRFDGVCRVIEHFSKTLPIYQIADTSLACYRA